jgi:hypothetical protein
MGLSAPGIDGKRFASVHVPSDLSYTSSKPVCDELARREVLNATCDDATRLVMFFWKHVEAQKLRSFPLPALPSYKKHL